MDTAHQNTMPAIFTEVQSPQDWLDIIPQLRMLTIASEQDEVDLRRKSTEVKIFGKELAEFCQALQQEMRKAHGIGLAAPQMGVFQRVFVSQIDPEREALIAINPQIRPVAESKEFGEEGCLSVPGISAQVERWPAIKVRAQDPYGKSFELYLEGIDAICFQHENDHLDGILFIDYLSRSQQRKIRKYFAEEAAVGQSALQDSD